MSDKLAERTYEINVRITVDDDAAAEDVIDRMMDGMTGWAASYKEVTEDNAEFFGGAGMS